MSFYSALPSVASICAACWPSTPPTTTSGDRIDHCSYVRHARTTPVPEPIHGRIRRRPILGGLICEYEAAA